MKNYEKYGNELIQLARDSVDDCTAFVIPVILDHMGLECGDISCDTCYRLFSLWLLNEYKETEVDWSRISVDTKVYVKDNENDEWIKRYFAKYHKGRVYTWMYGGTSWISDETETECWKYAKLAGEEN